MKRRSFLKGSAFAVAAATVAPSLVFPAYSRERKEPFGAARDFHFRKDGTFKILQITDTHYIAGDPRSFRALRCVEELLDVEQPDFVIHTGDVIFGSPSGESARAILSPMVERGIPFAVAMGNHDGQFDLDRAALYNVIRELPGCLNTPPDKGIHGHSNDLFTLSSDRLERAFYLFDSGDAVVLRGEEEWHCYDYIRFDQMGWYREESLRLREENGGTPLPSLAFFHIPLREIEEGLASPDRELIGNNEEPPCPSRLNSGLLAQMREMGDVEAIVTGHDHDCDYVLRYGPMFYIYGRYSGCDTVYNHLGASGGRVFEFKSGETGFRTWVRLAGGEVCQCLSVRDGRMEQTTL